MPPVLFNFTSQNFAAAAALAATGASSSSSSVVSVSSIAGHSVPETVPFLLFPSAEVALFVLLIGTFVAFCICAFCAGGACGLCREQQHAWHAAGLPSCKLVSSQTRTTVQDPAVELLRRRNRQQSVMLAYASHLPSLLILQLLEQLDDPAATAAEGGGVAAERRQSALRALQARLNVQRTSLYDHIRSASVRPAPVNRAAERTLREARKELQSVPGAASAELLELLDNVHLQAILQSMDVTVEEVFAPTAACTPATTPAAGGNECTKLLTGQLEVII
ncbi:hypothetical protein niasHT_036662 [Heterodera trifolii]|uniref:Transmembrane protein n=1 Tax=Heterodera trifolii TaxID=157864 RepID=A0ABD2I7E4_9BILA